MPLEPPKTAPGPGWIRGLLRAVVPEDPAPGCGYGPFKLDLNHPFTPACDLHDWDFGLSHAGIPERSKDQADADLFWRWALIARAEKDPRRQIALLWDIIELWPLARIAGGLMWDGDPIHETKD